MFAHENLHCWCATGTQVTDSARHPSERRDSTLAARGVRQRRVALAAALGVALVGVSASAALRVLAIEDAPVAVPMVSAAAMDPLASPAQGSTGTIALPAEPHTQPLPTDFATGIVAARPFAMGAASALDRGRALECLTAAIYYEAASESDDGERAVAQVVLNRVRHPAFPATVCGVVYQGSDRATGCQFSFACDGAMARVPSRTGWLRALRIAAAALGGQVFAPVGLATHYHTFAVTPAWNRTLVMTDAIGAHFFHRWKGYWGTASAFHQAYRGGEAMPGPIRSVAPPAPVAMAAAATVQSGKRAEPSYAAPVIQPAHMQSGQPVAAERDDRLPHSPVLDRWKDSGQFIR